MIGLVLTQGWKVHMETPYLMDTGSLPMQRMEPEAIKVRWHPYTSSLLFNTTHAHGVPKQMMPWETCTFWAQS